MKWIDLPPVWLLGCLVLGWAQARLVPFPVFGAAGDVLGWLCVAAGLGLMAAAVAEMLRHRTTVIPRERPSALVTSGVFGWTRNPIYLGDALVLTGCGLIWDAGLALALVPVFMALITRRFILGEEAGLRSAYAADFAAYEKRVRRWI
jgi:protein-S-isoprenylcysteine O-methyltransferase Ste14